MLCKGDFLSKKVYTSHLYKTTRKPCLRLVSFGRCVHDQEELANGSLRRRDALSSVALRPFSGCCVFCKVRCSVTVPSVSVCLPLVLLSVFCLEHRIGYSGQCRRRSVGPDGLVGGEAASETSSYRAEVNSATFQPAGISQCRFLGPGKLCPTRRANL